MTQGPDYGNLMQMVLPQPNRRRQNYNAPAKRAAPRHSGNYCGIILKSTRQNAVKFGWLAISTGNF